MRFEQDLRQHLLNKLPLIAFVEERIYPVVRPQGSGLPAITYRRMSGGRNQYLNAAGGRVEPQVEFLIFSKSYEETKRVGEELRLALQGLAGAVGFETQITCTMDVDESDSYEPPQDGSDSGEYVLVRVFQFQYREPRVAEPTP